MTLETMLQRHDRGDYLLHHWSWAVKSAISAKQAARLLKAHMDGLLRQAAEQGHATDGLERMAAMAQLYIDDLWELTPGEFENLRKLNDEDLIHRVPLDTSGMAPWLAQELKKEGGNLRFRKGE